MSWNSTRMLLCHFSRGKTHCYTGLCKTLPFPREASTPYHSLHFWSWKLTHYVLVRVLQNKGLIGILKMIVWLEIVTSCSWFLCRSWETWKSKVFVFLHLYISREMTWSHVEGPGSLKSHHMPTSSASDRNSLHFQRNSFRKCDGQFLAPLYNQRKSVFLVLQRLLQGQRAASYGITKGKGMGGCLAAHIIYVKHLTKCTSVPAQLGWQK